MRKKGQKTFAKSAQMQMSFGMIFSIILIVAFLAFAFFGIKTFLGIQNSAKSAKLASDLQADIDKVWKSAQSSEEKQYILPEKKSFACFVVFDSGVRGPKSGIYNELKRADYGKENFVFYPVELGGGESFEIKHIALASITQNENPFCISNINGKLKLKLLKDFDEDLVRIERVG